jgi:hypothetical protein
MIDVTPGRKMIVKGLAKRFGGCGCKRQCQVEQYGEETGSESKPRGRFSVCEIEADRLGVTLPERNDP